MYLFLLEEKQKPLLHLKQPACSSPLNKSTRDTLGDAVFRIWSEPSVNIFLKMLLKVCTPWENLLLIVHPKEIKKQKIL